MCSFSHEGKSMTLDGNFKNAVDIQFLNSLDKIIDYWILLNKLNEYFNLKFQLASSEKKMALPGVKNLTYSHRLPFLRTLITNLL